MKIRLNIKSFQQTAITTDSAKLTRTLEIVWVDLFFSLVSSDELHSREAKGHIIYNTACKFMVKDRWIQFPRKKPVPVISSMKVNL